MAQLRNEFGTGYDMSDERRRNLCTGIGANIWRAMKRGEVRAGPSLAVFVQDVVFRLREAKSVQESQRAWCSWGGWAVRCVIDDQRAKQTRDEASAHLIARIRREKEEARGSVDAFLSEVGAGSLRDYVRSIGSGDDTKEEVLTHERAFTQSNSRTPRHREAYTHTTAAPLFRQ